MQAAFAHARTVSNAASSWTPGARASTARDHLKVAAVVVLAPRADLAVAKLGHADNWPRAESRAIGSHEPIDPLGERDIADDRDGAELNRPAAEADCFHRTEELRSLVAAGRSPQTSHLPGAVVSQVHSHRLLRRRDSLAKCAQDSPEHLLVRHAEPPSHVTEPSMRASPQRIVLALALRTPSRNTPSRVPLPQGGSISGSHSLSQPSFPATRSC